jgi:hypothetical protein
VVHRVPFKLLFISASPAARRLPLPIYDQIFLGSLGAIR